MYIGQTFGGRGAIGRLAEHLSLGTGSTFRKRLCQVKNFEDVAIGRVRFAAHRLSDHSVFHDDARDYREAVEVLVQYQLLNELLSRKLALGVVSRVTSNAYTEQDFVKTEAAMAVGSFLEWLIEGARLDGM